MQDTETKKQNPFPTGPRRYGWITTGQQRRRLQREKLAKGQKANKAYRQNWFKDQRRIATLRGWLIILDNPQHFSERQVDDIRDIMYLDFLKHYDVNKGDVDEDFDLVGAFADSVVELKEAFAEDLAVAAERLM